jgi:creatinine amidohydrolase/Fe(II)-dependent formamide hydrolase-like protein
MACFLPQIIGKFMEIMVQEKQLCGLISKAIGVEEKLITFDTKSSDFPEWDSLGHINILMAIQEHYGEGYQGDPSLASAVSVKEIFEAL